MLPAVSKRPTSESDALIKRQRTDEQDPTLQQLVVAAPDAQGAKGALIQTVRRTSGLNAPIMCLRVSSHLSPLSSLDETPSGADYEDYVMT